MIIDPNAFIKAAVLKMIAQVEIDKHKIGRIRCFDDRWPATIRHCLQQGYVSRSKLLEALHARICRIGREMARSAQGNENPINANCTVSPDALAYWLQFGNLSIEEGPILFDNGDTAETFMKEQVGNLPGILLADLITDTPISAVNDPHNVDPWNLID